MGQGQKPQGAGSEARSRGRLGSLNAHPTGTPTVAPGTAAFAALLARIGRSDRRHGIRYFYCLGGHALAVAGYQPGPSLTTRRFPPPWSVAAARRFARVRVSEQIGQPQPGCERYDDRDSNERKHPVRVRHSVSSNASGTLSAFPPRPAFSALAPADQNACSARTMPIWPGPAAVT